MEAEVVRSEMVLPTVLGFKRIQMSDKYPKGQSRGRYWKHLKQLLQSENFGTYPPNEPNCKPLSFFASFFKILTLNLFYSNMDSRIISPGLV